MILNRFVVRLLRPQTVLVIVALLGSLLLTHHAMAQQSPEVRATYGRGVHAFFANRTSDAERMFNQVVAAGSTDPRVYYFRAVARMRLGRKHEAEQDMQTGAAYEARDPGNRHAIGNALQRIQGPARRTLERFRREARLYRAQERRQQTKQRYERLERRNPKVLRQENPVQLDQLVDPLPAVNTPPAIETAGEDSLQPVVPEANAAEKTPAEVAAPADDDLFGDPAPVTENQPTEEPADDLFGEPAAEQPPVPAEEADPFGAEEPAEDPMPVDSEDPFGATEEPTAASVDEPAEGALSDPAPVETPAEGDNDPFGVAASSEEPASEEVPMPADSSDDLFGDPVAEEPAVENSDAPADDLFGDPAPAEPATQPADDASDDLFGDEPPAADESLEEPVAPEQDGAEPAEDEADDLFGATSEEAKDATPSTSGTLAATDKVESGKLMGILGRVVSSTVPWRGVRIPAIGPQGATESADVPPEDSFELGPSNDDLATPASAEQPLEADADDLFGTAEPAADSTGDPFAEEPADDDPFGAGPSEEETPLEEGTEPFSDEDPFGDF